MTKVSVLDNIPDTHFKTVKQHWQFGGLEKGTPNYFSIVSNDVHAKFNADTYNVMETSWKIESNMRLFPRLLVDFHFSTFLFF